MMGGPNASADSPLVIEIRDPIAGYQYTLDTYNHIADRVKTTPFPRPNGVAPGIVQAGVVGAIAPSTNVAPPPPPPPAMLSATAQSVNQNGPTSTTEKLGTQMMEGVLAEGRRVTSVIPAGVEGNDAPMTIVRETWNSPQIQMVVLSKTTDPRSGENTMRLTNITIGDPDPALFQPPGDYQVVDDTGPFQIRFTAPARQ